ncbi:MAG: GNAT family N-acetyltransferase [Nakamurella sp.]
MPTQDVLDLLLAEAGLIWGEQEHGLLGDNTVLAVARTVDGRLATRAGCRELSDDSQPLTSGCVSFLVPDSLPERSIPAELMLRHHDDAGWLTDRAPADWSPKRWQDLLGGGLGPWAALTDAGGVVTLCHSARLSAIGAEAGVRTELTHRGRGLAAVVVTGWAVQLRERRIPLYYSASDGNSASLRAATTLGLTPLGRLWRVFVDTPA